MDGSLEQVVAMFPEVYEQSQWNLQNTFVILQGIAGFASGVVGTDPFASIGAVLEVAGHFAQQCDTGTLQENLDKIEQWMKFGEEYAARENPSDLDFDKMNVESVPEVMQVTTRALLHDYV